MATPEELKAAGITPIEDGRFGEYQGSLIDDCMSIVEQGKELEALRAKPAAANIFETAWARNLIGDGKLQKRERDFGGHYSNEN